MNYKITDKSESSKEIEITVPLEDMQNYLEQAAVNLKLEIKGFRPGKAPLKIVQDAVGEEKLWHEAVHLAINETYFKAINETNMEAISSPQIEIDEIKINQPLTYKASVAIIPELSLPDYKKIAKETFSDKKDVEIETKEIDEAINMIQKSRAKAVRVLRESKNGDEVIVDFQGKIDNTLQEGLKGDKVSIVLGEKRFIKEFEEEIVGLKEGDKKDFTIKIPFTKGDHKNVEFNVEIVSVNERELPQIDDDFAKSLGDFSGIEDLKEKIKDNLKVEKEFKKNQSLRVKAIEMIGKESKTEIPELLIEREIDNMIQDLKLQLSQAGLSLKDYLGQEKKEEKDLREEWKPEAQKRIKTSLVLREIAKKEKIMIDEKELKKEVDNYLSQISDENTKKKIEIDQLEIYLRERITNEKVFQLLESF
ncbi:MAG: trigger factor [Minisyncoccales bacterium]|jgi:trigger factor